MRQSPTASLLGLGISNYLGLAALGYLLGQAARGQFSIEARDTNNPHIKKVRVVSTVEYYLSD